MDMAVLDVTIPPEEVEHKDLQRFLGAVLDAYASGRIDRNRARALLAHVTTAAKSHQDGEYRRFIALEPEAYLEALTSTR